MNNKRWFALVIAIGLFVISIVVQLSTSVATANFDQMFNFEDNQLSETVIEEGAVDKKIAVLHLEGVIQDASGGSLINANVYNHKRFLDTLDQAGEDSSVKGIIIRVNSPGGGVVESAEIHDKIVDIQNTYQKPVYVSMGNTAASGGYYISAPADKIVAHPATLTGSIGVIMESFNFAEFAEEHGINFNTIKSGKYKDIMSSSRKMTDDERDILQTMIDDLYGDFVDVIVEGREMKEQRVREIGDGRVYTGSQAKEINLVDELGTLDDTITLMKKDNQLGKASVIEYEKGLPFNQLLSGTMENMLGTEKDLFGIQEFLRQSNGPRAMYLYSE
ncbi:signal peptide peptidase SppA [Virgibacillus halodenitrificans]|uniref:signal peptide peptidase SppA n=1 Tax=Virgibacillus halodenitrificans TaxID=1482 RepID=UPI001F264D55|nr:signal peptide peptidase SppA [Virgibacillus halodenitrificans]